MTCKTYKPWGGIDEAYGVSIDPSLCRYCGGRPVDHPVLEEFEFPDIMSEKMSAMVGHYHTLYDTGVPYEAVFTSKPVYTNHTDKPAPKFIVANEKKSGKACETCGYRVLRRTRCKTCNLLTCPHCAGIYHCEDIAHD